MRLFEGKLVLDLASDPTKVVIFLNYKIPKGPSINDVSSKGREKGSKMSGFT